MGSVTIPSLALNNGVTIPQLGFGTYKLPAERTLDAVACAVEAGYRHIDTAAMYRNEREVGQAIAATGLPRGDFFVTTKLNNAHHAHDDALAAFDQSLEALGMDYVDLYLIHWPLPAIGLYPQAWEALEEIAASGKARTIGVSNFQPAHIDRLLASGTVTPALNQIECHPYLSQ
ncbi:MAG: aldo/keto reductase, partial [Cellulomonadaceae bacterium]|nr:aldo/keto reductase [Cellulomonadaceae bacterium]